MSMQVIVHTSQYLMPPLFFRLQYIMKATSTHLGKASTTKLAHVQYTERVWFRHNILVHKVSEKQFKLSNFN